MQPERHLGVLGRIGRSLLDGHLIESQLLHPLARNILKMNRALAEVLQCQGIEVMATARSI